MGTLPKALYLFPNCIFYVRQTNRNHKQICKVRGELELIELHDAQQKGCNVCTFKKKLFFIVGAFFFLNKNVVFCKGFPLSKYDSSIKGESFMKKSLLTIYDCTFLWHPNDFNS